jgi:hypothetical protein
VPRRILFLTILLVFCLRMHVHLSSSRTDSSRNGTLLASDPESGVSVCYDADQGLISFQGVPASVRPLRIRPARREADLDKDTWLVLVFAITSDSDVRSIFPAISAASKLGEGILLGIRPFADYDEAKTWYKEYGNRESPLWIVIQNGKVMTEEKGTLSENIIVDFVTRALKR